ncbi:RimK family alpha-L-glutamate ligase [Streptomyces solincola]|uniref:RimK family alpha-L-glutamate ligase n=1 Tax=Streptomyces solincola TaxID=2100817 RepID=UPI001C616AB5|nr:RimK family alpha-L-glutamate ligase [Streptomyces solincola]
MNTPTTGPATAAVLASRIRLEEKRILQALEARGVPVVHLDPRRLELTVGGAAGPWSVVLNREISATRARYAALGLEAAGTTVVNSAAATGICGDKWLTSLALHRAGVPSPRTALSLTPEAALDAVHEGGYPVVVKPLSSSWGRRVSLLRDHDAAEAVMEHCAALPAPQAHLIYRQELIDKPGRDIRVVVVDGRAVGAAYRTSESWRTNVARGARTEPCPLTPELAGAAVAAARAVDAVIAGVDVVEDREGRLYVLEVNSGVEFAGLEASHQGRVDVADAIAALVADAHRLASTRTAGGCAPAAPDAAALEGAVR